MSQSQLQTLETLHDENRRLNAQLAQVQNRLACYETFEEDDAPQWNVWPYCWFVALGDFCVERFHSFHGKLVDANLTRRNLRARRVHEAEIEKETRALRLL